MKKYNLSQLIIIFNIFWLIGLNFSYMGVAANSSISISFDEVSQITSSQDSFIQCERIGDILFTLSITSGLKTYDISDIEHPIFLDSTQEEHYSHHFDINGDLSCIADFTFGIKIYNISNPLNLIKMGQYLPAGTGGVNGVCVNESLLVANDVYTSPARAKILFINITDPTLPTLISIIDDGVSFFQRFYVENDLCYASSYNNGFKIYNISDLSAITEIYHYNELFAPLSFKKIGNTIYVGDFNYFRILNVNDLTDFKIIGEYYTPNDIADISVFNSLAFISERETCLTVLDISNTTNLQKIGQFDVPYIYSCYIDEQYLYLSLGDNGIKIMSYNIITSTNNLPIIVNIFEIIAICGIIILSMRVYLKYKNYRKLPYNTT